jgi:hypothetical protein
MCGPYFRRRQRDPRAGLEGDVEPPEQILEIVCLNLTLDGVRFVPEVRKPFDVLVEGLSLAESRGGRIRTDDFLHPKQAL